MNRSRAAGRGALVAVLWASALLAFLAAVRTTKYAEGVLALADVLFEPDAFPSGLARIVSASLVAAAVVGAGVALLARHVRASAWIRAAVLSLASFPALYALVALALTLIWLPDGGGEDFAGFAAVSLAPLASLYAMWLVTPVAALSAVLAALMVEGWTRPEGGRASGLAHPSVRWWVTHVLLVVTAAFATFAAFRWPRS